MLKQSTSEISLATRRARRWHQLTEPPAAHRTGEGIAVVDERQILPRGFKERQLWFGKPF